MVATTTADHSLRVLLPTLVPKALATSFAPGRCKAAAMQGTERECELLTQPYHLYYFRLPRPHYRQTPAVQA